MKIQFLVLLSVHGSLVNEYFRGNGWPNSGIIKTQNYEQ